MAATSHFDFVEDTNTTETSGSFTTLITTVVTNFPELEIVKNSMKDLMYIPSEMDIAERRYHRNMARIVMGTVAFVFLTFLIGSVFTYYWRMRKVRLIELALEEGRGPNPINRRPNRRAMFQAQVLAMVLANIAVAAGLNDCPSLCRCPELFLSVDCSRTLLTNVPEDISPMILYLDFSHNQLRTIPKDLSSLHRLQRLNLNDNDIGVIAYEDLFGLTSLKHLDMSRNALTSWEYVNVAFMHQSSNLQVLDLSHNNISMAPGSRQLLSDSLFELILVNCSINGFYNNTFFSRLTNLTRLNLANNPIRYLPARMFTKLTYLNMSGCNLQTLNILLFINLPALEHLFLARNYEMSSFTANISSQTLKYLDISDCNLESIPHLNMPMLSKINMSGNNIREIPDHIFNSAGELKVIILANNSIFSVEQKAFYKMRMLAHLDLSFNRLFELPQTLFSTCTRLNEMVISHNYLRSLNFRILALKRLVSSHNEIQLLHADDLRYMPGLVVLDLSYNWITEIPDGLEARELAYLDLSMCRIWTLNNLTFVAMPRLSSLKLNGNRLSANIGRECFHNVVDLTLRDNPWRCDCDNLMFRGLFFWLTSNNRKVDYNQLKCLSPEAYEGKHWLEACDYAWSDQSAMTGILLYGLIIVFVLIISFCVAMSYRRSKIMNRRRELDRREAAQAVLNNRREQTIRDQNRAEREAREARVALEAAVRPPSYAEALLMPLPRTGTCAPRHAEHTEIEMGDMEPRAVLTEIDAEADEHSAVEEVSGTESSDEVVLLEAGKVGADDEAQVGPTETTI